MDYNFDNITDTKVASYDYNGSVEASKIYASMVEVLKAKGDIEAFIQAKDAVYCMSELLTKFKLSCIIKNNYDNV